MNQNILDPFINDLLEQQGYADAEPAVKEALQKDLRVKIDDFIMTRTIAALSEEDFKTFEQMIDEKKSRSELQQFAMDHIPEYTTFLASALVEFEEVYLSTN